MENEGLGAVLAEEILAAFQGVLSPYALMGNLEVIGSVIVGKDGEADKCQNHAEKKIAERAGQESQTLLGVGASHRVCTSCQQATWSGSPAAILFPLGSSLLCSFRDN